MKSKPFPFRAIVLQGALAAAGLCVLPLAQAQSKMTDAAYSDAKHAIETQYDADKKACDAMTGNAKDVCKDEAEGKEKVAKAELTYKRSGKAKDQMAVHMARADAVYEVAKEKCDDSTGSAKDACVKEAKAVHARARADAKTKHGDS